VRNRFLRKVLKLICAFPLMMICDFTSTAGEIKKQDVIAVVNGSLITSSDIAVKKETVIHAFLFERGRDPTSEELSGEITKAEERKLISRIASILREKALQEFGVTVTAEEARVELEKLYPGLKENPEGTLEKEKAFWKQYALALKEVKESPEKERLIYDSRLKDFMEYETWKAAIKSFGTHEKIKRIERAIPKSIEDIYRDGESSMKDLVLDEKLRSAITRDVKITEEEVQKIYESRFDSTVPKPSFDEVRASLQKELLELKKSEFEQAWWVNFYKKAKIEIRDDRFRSVIETLKTSVKK